MSVQSEVQRIKNGKDTLISIIEDLYPHNDFPTAPVSPYTTGGTNDSILINNLTEFVRNAYMREYNVIIKAMSFNNQYGLAIDDFPINLDPEDITAEISSPLTNGANFYIPTNQTIVINNTTYYIYSIYSVGTHIVTSFEQDHVENVAYALLESNDPDWLEGQNLTLDTIFALGILHRVPMMGVDGNIYK